MIVGMNHQLMKRKEVNINISGGMTGRQRLSLALALLHHLTSSNLPSDHDY